tara:strand:- start:3022 stop:5133 length:2112 start_codon:yes stop_codon:yes gene_type:complete
MEVKKKYIVTMLTCLFSYKSYALGDEHLSSWNMMGDGSDINWNHQELEHTFTFNHQYDPLLISFDDPQKIPDIFQYTGAAPWLLMQADPHMGLSLKSPTTQVGQSSDIVIQFMSQGGSVSFDLALFDVPDNNVKFYINGEEQLVVANQQAFQHYEYSLPQDQMVSLKWSYQKRHHHTYMHAGTLLDNLKINANLNTDFDDLNDAWEYKYFRSLQSQGHEHNDLDTLNNQVEFTHKTNPLLEDTDGDSFHDDWEVKHQFNPLIDDSLAIKSYKRDQGYAKLSAAHTFFQNQRYTEAFNFIYSAVNDYNYAPAELELAHYYHYGWGTQPNAQEALRWYQTAAEKDAKAQYELAQLYEKGEVAQLDIDQAEQLYQQAAEAGFAAAQYYWGSLNIQDKYWERGVYWLKKAAAQNYPQAESHLGYLYQKGIGMTANKTESKHYFLQAAQHHDIDGQYQIGQILEEEHADMSEVIKWYELAAKQGQVQAQVRLGKIYLRDIIYKDIDKAVHWFDMAAKQGDAIALYQLSHLYRSVYGVTKNLMTATSLRLASQEQFIPASEISLSHAYLDYAHSNHTASLYQSSAEEGKRQAQYILGTWHLSGTYVSYDPQKAMHWLTQAAQQGHMHAQYKLGLSYKRGKYTETNIELARAWFNAAAQQGHLDAIYQLGLLYQNELSHLHLNGVSWLAYAAHRGHVDAIQKLEYYHLYH